MAAKPSTPRHGRHRINDPRPRTQCFAKDSIAGALPKKELMAATGSRQGATSSSGSGEAAATARLRRLACKGCWIDGACFPGSTPHLATLDTAAAFGGGMSADPALGDGGAGPVVAFERAPSGVVPNTSRCSTSDDLWKGVAENFGQSKGMLRRGNTAQLACRLQSAQLDAFPNLELSHTLYGALGISLATVQRPVPLRTGCAGLPRGLCGRAYVAQARGLHHG